MIVQEGSLLIDVLQMHSVQSLSHVRLFVTPWIAARQAFLSITNSRSSHRLTSIESEMPPSHLILSRPLLLLPPIPPSIRVFSNESTLHMRWPKDWSFSYSMHSLEILSVWFQTAAITKDSNANNFATTNHTWCWEGLGAGGEGDDRGWDD